MAEIGLTEVSATSQELVASIVQETLKEKAMLLPTITDYSSFVDKGGKSVKIPRRDVFAAADKAENTSLSKQELTFAVDEILLDKHKAILASIEMIAEEQATPSVRQEVIQEMADELALQVDRDLLAQLKAVSSSSPDHLLDYADSAGDKLARTDFAEARKLLRRQKVQVDNRWWCVIPPEQEKNLLDIEGFIEADKYGSREALLNGEIGRVFHFRVLVHTELAAADALFYHASHVGYATQIMPQFDTDKDLDNVAEKFLIHTLYGTKVLDSGKRGVYFNGSGS